MDVRPDDEAFLLDVLNSTPIADAVEHDALGTPESAQDWLRGHGGDGTPAERRALVAARDVLQAVVRGVVAPSALEPLLDGVTSRPSLDAGRVEWAVETPRSRRLAVRAVLAWDTVQRSAPGRLRPCENPECALFLIDHSKPNRARWCSMAVCGNRMKARRHYERTRAGSDA